MGAAFWIKRYLLAAVPLFAVLAAVEWFRGSTSPNDYLIAAIWALGAAALFTWTTYRRYRDAISARFPAAANDANANDAGGAGTTGNAGRSGKAGKTARKP